MFVLESINQFVWGIPALVMIIMVGIYLSFCTGFAQFRLFPQAIKNFIRQFTSRNGKGGSSTYTALCTALAATVGTGNVVGVAGAIMLGGPGAVFWMWICAFLGMIIKFAEATLAVHFRVKTANGDVVGGPMYIIQEGLGEKWRFLAVIYCVFGFVASFGVGNITQINAVIMSVRALVKFSGSCSSISLELIVALALCVGS